MTARITTLAPPAPLPAQVNEPALFYAPPYERPVEDEFAWHLVKYLDERAGLLYQHRAATPAGPVWVDFVVEAPLGGGAVRRVGFELTGADEDAAEAALRDALAIGTAAGVAGDGADAGGGLDVLYRVDADAALYRLHDVLALVRRWEPALFSERGRINLERLASPDVLALTLSPAQGLAYVAAPEPLAEPFDDAPDEADPFGVVPEPLRPLRLARRSAAHPVTWLRDFDAAAAHFGVAVPPRRQAA